VWDGGWLGRESGPSGQGTEIHDSGRRVAGLGRGKGIAEGDRDRSNWGSSARRWLIVLVDWSVLFQRMARAVLRLQIVSDSLFSALSFPTLSLSSIVVLITADEGGATGG
jgi:hypothetical protein